MSEVIYVQLAADLINFEMGQWYPGEKLKKGWKITHPATGTSIGVPNEMILDSKFESQIKQEALKRDNVEDGMGTEEKSILNAFRDNIETISTPAAEQQPPKKKSVVQRMLEEEAALLTTKKPPEFMSDEEIQRSRREKEVAKIRLKLAHHPQPRLQEYQCFLSDLTGGVLPDSEVDHIITAYPPGHFPAALERDIPEFDLYHEWDPNVLEHIVLAHKLNTKNLMVGFPGSGKSTSAQQFAALIRQPFMKINGKADIDGSAFIGFMGANSTGTFFSEGLLPVAMRNGYLLCIDEVFKIPAEVQMNFQTVYEENGFLLLDEKPGLLADKLVHPHPDFRLMATDNAYGTGDNFEKFGATQVQDGSTLDRFGMTQTVPYLKYEKEVDILSRMYPMVRKDSIGRLVKAAGLVREAYQQSNLSITLSMRGLKVMARLLLTGVSERSAFSMAYAQKVADDAEVNTVASFISTVGLSSKPGGGIKEVETPPLAPNIDGARTTLEDVVKAADEKAKELKEKVNNLPPPWSASAKPTMF